VSTVTLVKAIQTCTACPSQWDAWDDQGRYWYLRYRSGLGTMGRGYDLDEAQFSFDDGDGGGEISLEEFCERTGVTLALDAPAPAALEAPPALPGAEP